MNTEAHYWILANLGITFFFTRFGNGLGQCLRTSMNNSHLFSGVPQEQIKMKGRIGEQSFLSLSLLLSVTTGKINNADNTMRNGWPPCDNGNMLPHGMGWPA